MEISECYDSWVKTVTALDVRRHFGRLLDEAGAGERFVIERAGQPIAALVSLADLATVDPELQHAQRLAAAGELRRLAAEAYERYGPWEEDATATIRRMRDERAAHVDTVVTDSTEARRR